VAGEGDIHALERLLNVGLTMFKSYEPQPSLNGAHPLLEQTLPQVGKTRCVMPANIIAMIQDGPLRRSSFKHHCVEDQTGPLRTQWNSMPIGEQPQTLHHGAPDPIQLAGM
jgi:hypothetical protein